MNLHLEFQYTFEEFKEAQQTHVKRLFKSVFRFGKLWWALTVGLAVMFFLVLQTKNSPPSPPPPAVDSSSSGSNSLKDLVTPLLPWLLWMGVVALILYTAFRRKWIFTGDWKGNAWLHETRVMEINEEAVRTRTRLTDVMHRWEAFIRQVETPNLFVLYVSENAIEMIPKRAFGSPEEVAAFREFITGKISPRDPSTAAPISAP